MTLFYHVWLLSYTLLNYFTQALRGVPTIPKKQLIIQHWQCDTVSVIVQAICCPMQRCLTYLHIVVFTPWITTLHPEGIEHDRYRLPWFCQDPRFTYLVPLVRIGVSRGLE